MKDLVSRLSSRTFWVAVLTVITLCLNEQWGEAATVAAAYILGEKGLDAVSAAKSKTVNTSSVTVADSDSSLDTSDVWTGAARQRTTTEITEDEG